MACSDDLRDDDMMMFWSREKMLRYFNSPTARVRPQRTDINKLIEENAELTSAIFEEGEEEEE